MEKITLGAGQFSVEIWSRGACVNDIRMPDKYGQVSSVVLGYDHQADRLAGSAYLAEVCGPFANRIAAGGYVIDGQTYTPPLNDSGTATLHGGPNGWSTQQWEVMEADEQHVMLHLDWTDPSGGFPGPIHADVDYRLDGWALTQTIRATTEAPTVLSVVAHPYFNLSNGEETIEGHELEVPACRYLPIDDASIPTLEAPAPVHGTPLDFQTPRLLGEALAQAHPQLTAHGGIDHALIIDGQGHRVDARLRHVGAGREVTISSDYPALQVYTGQFLDDDHITHPVGVGRARSGVALETEEYPDAPRRSDFPSVVVRPGEVYSRTTTWQFALIP